MAELSESFLRRVEPEPNTGCWLWSGGANDMGYGVLIDDGRSVYAHRVAYSITNGTIPPGLHICHKCDVPLCVNPDHLYAGTRSQNMQDSLKRGRFCVGSRHPMSKLSEDDVRDIRLLSRSGMTQRAIAQRFGVHQKTVSFIVLGKTRRRVHDVR